MATVRQHQDVQLLRGQCKFGAFVLGMGQLFGAIHRPTVVAVINLLDMCSMQQQLETYENHMLFCYGGLV